MSAIIIYARRSTDRQDLTHDAQEAAGRLWAESRGLSVAGVFCDTCSGSVSPLEREGFSAAVETISEGDILWVQRRDRLGRDVVANAFAQKFIEKHGARVVSGDCGDQVGPESDLMANLLDSFAQYERSLIAMRTRRALARRRAKGLVTTGSAPLGHRADHEGMMELNAEETANIERVRRWYRAGLPFADIQERCEAEGIKSRSGATPSTVTLRRWVKGIERDIPAKRRPSTGKPAGRKPVAAGQAGLVGILRSLRESGKTWAACAQHLEEEGYRNSKGNPFHRQQLQRVLARAR
jgi:DNA invertase Pin-like site-specific DNA recombinase